MTDSVSQYIGLTDEDEKVAMTSLNETIGWRKIGKQGIGSADKVEVSIFKAHPLFNAESTVYYNKHFFGVESVEDQKEFVYKNVLGRWELPGLAEHYAMFGFVDVVEFIARGKEKDRELSRSIARGLIRFGDNKLFKKYLDRVKYNADDIFTDIARYGIGKMFASLVVRNMDVSKECLRACMKIATNVSNLNIMKHLVNFDSEFSTIGTCIVAAKNGDIELIKIVMDKQQFGFTDILEIVESVLDTPKSFGRSNDKYPAHLELLKFLLSEDFTNSLSNVERNGLLVIACASGVREFLIEILKFSEPGDKFLQLNLCYERIVESGKCDMVGIFYDKMGSNEWVDVSELFRLAVSRGDSGMVKALSCLGGKREFCFEDVRIRCARDDIETIREVASEFKEAIRAGIDKFLFVSGPKVGEFLADLFNVSYQPIEECNARMRYYRRCSSMTCRWCEQQNLIKDDCDTSHDALDLLEVDYTDVVTEEERKRGEDFLTQNDSTRVLYENNYDYEEMCFPKPIEHVQSSDLKEEVDGIPMEETITIIRNDGTTLTITGEFYQSKKGSRIFKEKPVNIKDSDLDERHFMDTMPVRPDDEKLVSTFNSRSTEELYDHSSMIDDYRQFSNSELAE